MADISRVAYQVMWTRLISVVEEQAQALIKEAQDAEVYTAFMNWVRKTLKVDELEEVHAKRYGMVKDRLQSAIDARAGK